MKVICKICTKEFDTKPARIKDGRGKYCSRSCYAKSCVGRSPAHKGKKITNLSESWYEVRKNTGLKLSGENHPQWKGGKDRFPECKHCGVKTSSMKSICCKKCKGLDKAGENHPMWKGGVSDTKEYIAHYSRLDKYRRRNADGQYSFDEWQKLKEKYLYMCLCCKRQEPFIKLTVDHIIPISTGGKNTIDNIQPLCRSCNSRKNVKIIDYRCLSVEEI